MKKFSIVHKIIRENINKLYYSKSRDFCSLKDITKRLKRQVTQVGENISEKVLISR